MGDRTQHIDGELFDRVLRMLDPKIETLEDRLNAISQWFNLETRSGERNRGIMKHYSAEMEKGRWTLNTAAEAAVNDIQGLKGNVLSNPRSVRQYRRKHGDAKRIAS